MAQLANSPADFVVQFVEQADLSPALEMSWEARGHYVYNNLMEVAQRSQAGTRIELDRRGLTFRSFIAGNELYVYAGDLPAAQALATLPEVALLRAPITYSIEAITESANPAAFLNLAPSGPSPSSSLSWPADPAALAWGVIDTKADQFWAAFGLQGEGVVVASLGTGIQWDHPALDQAYRCLADPGNLACWYDPANVCGGTPCDNVGISTHTLGTILADDDPMLTWQAGMAPAAQWIACKGCESGSCSEASLNACADWIVAPDGDPNNRPHIVNAPWGAEAVITGIYPK